MLDLIAPDLIATQFPDQLDVRDYHGHDGLHELMADWIGTWDDWTIEISGLRELGGQVLASGRQSGRGKESGAPMASEVIFVFTVQGGVITRWQMFHNEAEALKAVRLE
jgi:ketosteroid isomerase-like protein